MNFFSNKQINLLSILITAFIYFFLVFYIPQCHYQIKSYFYYKSQPENLAEYY